MMSADDPRTPQPPHSATTTFSPGPPNSHHSYFLPSNPMPYLAPSVTHQPELLLLHWMITTISTLVDDLQHHPIVRDPIPPMSTFTNTPAYRLFLQTRNTLRHLINTTHDARRGLARLQFLPGSPGSPGHYRIDPTIDIPPQQTNLLSGTTTQHNPATPSPTTTPPLHHRLHDRDRSRSRDRLPLTTLSQPNHTTSGHQIIPRRPAAAPGHRGHLHQALWTASTSSFTSTVACHLLADTPSTSP